MASVFELLKSEDTTLTNSEKLELKELFDATGCHAVYVSKNRVEYWFYTSTSMAFSYLPPPSCDHYEHVIGYWWCREIFFRD